MDLNKSETRWVAAGIGGAIGFISWAKDIKWIPGAWKYAIVAVRGYLWYFGFVAGYAVARGKCTTVVSGVTRFGSSYIPIPPTIWTRRC
ncbi:hypothetical protein OG887_42500 (plasmid) [Streptomyces sp. NBC_00053]|uniref:Integral membrane protein n=1 Tax=Streptomyces sanglieri TaxID=193460 RepID=A0ABW2X8Z5_9ACTN|nr:MULTISPECIES: hypothetical protein [unclassified Streptomyces]WSG56154.1 hypothetical protein OHA38_41235 [Streptomyces sp. NBC_01732]WSX07320.1 hypothetical protein OG355_44100 [Streptomyces sp. NBC_00987]MCX4399581.1 hypothetical protein [Streptomyces sp. NBC_01767]MCX5106621.1 hypothetical protein [Streptomyces sp. NBC_00439]MCX5165533.1 hypothetical protein [Streptomyces sp. NBC_00305]